MSGQKRSSTTDSYCNDYGAEVKFSFSVVIILKCSMTCIDAKEHSDN